MPTPIVYGDHLYICSNSGMLTCYEAATGKQVYTERLGGAGGYTASPVAADGRLYFAGEESGVRVVKAGPKFELLAVNPLGETCLATPAIADGLALFVRTEQHLVALGREAKYWAGRRRSGPGSSYGSGRAIRHVGDGEVLGQVLAERGDQPGSTFSRRYQAVEQGPGNGVEVAEVN